MAVKSGVQVKRNAKGKATYVAIDLRRHPQTVSLLKEAGIMPKSDFEKRCENAITTDELEASLQQLITDFYAKRNR